jgi:hypothetical protein
MLARKGYSACDGSKGKIITTKGRPNTKRKREILELLRGTHGWTEK